MPSDVAVEAAPKRPDTFGLGVLAKLLASEDVARFLASDGEGEKLRMVAAERDQTARVAHLQNE